LSRYRYGYYPGRSLTDHTDPVKYVEGGCIVGFDDPSFRCTPCQEDFDHELDIKPSDTPAQRAEKARKTAIATIARWMKLHPDIWQEIEYVLSQDDNDKFALSMRRAIVQRGDLTDKQRVAIRNYAEGKREWVVLKSGHDVGATDAPEGRTQITGTILSLKWKRSNLKMLLKADDGWKLYLNTPKSIIDTVREGDTVTMKVTVQPLQDNPKFAFGKRPAKVEKVARDVR
jgi:hypothetical protein